MKGESTALPARHLRTQAAGALTERPDRAHTRLTDPDHCLFYGLRLAGVNQWLALVLGAAVPLRLAVTVLTRRRVDRLSLFSLSLIGCGTAIGLVTADPWLLLARESYLTAVVGLWIIGSLLARTPFIFEATVRLMPPAQADAWRQDWEGNPTFRRIMRG
jgi:hypothetical protein